MTDAARLLAWLDAAPNREATGDFSGLKLAPVRAALARLPAPPALCTVAGTKGKGSTVRLIEGALLAAGTPTLAFTSPHVRHVCERWRIGGVPISAEAAWAHAQRVASAEAAAGVALTWFERTFAIACLAAAELRDRHADAVFLCEVGIGGRLDCANVLDAAVAVLTHISHDHRNVLGPTLHHIAREKLAIARPGRPLVIAPQTPVGALAVWRHLPIGVDARFVQPPASPFALALPGRHQQDNAAAALTAARLLRPGLDEAVARHGMAGAALAARCQVVERGARRIIVDGAHNRESILATIAVARERLRPGWRLVLGIAADKELAEIVDAIPPGLDVARCAYASPRCCAEAAWPSWTRSWPWLPDAGAAIAGTDADLCITGSFYLAGEALAALGAADALPG